MRRTKIVCTIGPASDDPTVLTDMIRGGMDIARINFSHGTSGEHADRISRIRTLAHALGRNVGILGDLAGPKLRTGNMTKESVVLKAGDPFRLTSEPIEGDWRAASVSFPGLSDAVKPGETILLNDGAIDLIVEAVTAHTVETRVRVGGMLGSHKGVNIPGRSLAIEALTAKDRDDIAFAVKHDLDWLALSFVRRPEDVRLAQKCVQQCGGQVPLIAKVEKREATEALDLILQESDGVMVARGDLGVEVDLEDVPFLQKMILARALEHEVPSITATHMLESMVESARPTRAEATDVATAVLDGTDAVMLSEETARGRFPVEAVRTMARIAERAERHLDHARFMNVGTQNPGVASAVARAACALATEVGATAIIVPTSGGTTPMQVSRRRPAQPIVAFTQDERVRRRLALVWGTVALDVPTPSPTDEVIDVCVEAARSAGLVVVGDVVVATGGSSTGYAGPRHLIEVIRVK
jgi:pyruvate kinase